MAEKKDKEFKAEEAKEEIIEEKKELKEKKIKEEEVKEENKKEVKKEPVSKSTAKKKPKISKKEYVVLNIIGEEFVLRDIYGNGVRISIPKGQEKAKIGDTIYL